MNRYTARDLYEYFEYDPEIQVRYLLNTIKNNGSLETVSTRFTLSSILAISFEWHFTSEGLKYWTDVYKKLLKEEKK